MEVLHQRIRRHIMHCNLSTPFTWMPVFKSETETFITPLHIWSLQINSAYCKDQSAYCPHSAFMKFTHSRHTHNRFTALFPGLPGSAGARRKLLLDFMVQEKIRCRHTNNPAGCHSTRTNQRPTSLIPHFYAECPFCCNSPNFSWLGTGTNYAGLHTQWLG